MRPEDKQQYLDMIHRVFVRAVRDTVKYGGDVEHELSEGEATDLLMKREEAAYARGLRAATAILCNEVEALWPALAHASHDGPCLSTAPADVSTDRE